MPFPKINLPAMREFKFGKLAPTPNDDATTVHDSREASSTENKTRNHNNKGFHGVPLSDPGSPDHPTKLVEWGVHWHKRPLLIMVIFMMATALALGHHYFYRRYDGHKPANDFQKRVVVFVGNILSFLAIFLWRMSCTLSYKQYIWTTVKKKSLKLSTLDHLFALTSDPRGFFSWEVWTRAKVLVLIAIIAWTTPIGGIGLSATLILVSEPANNPPSQVSMPAFDWKGGSWFPSKLNPVIPSPDVLNIATRVATNMDTLPFAAPFPASVYNSSYTIQIPGPYVQCAPTNSSQNSVLAGYAKVLASRHNVATASTFNDIEASGKFVNTPKEVVWSAFDPSLGGLEGWVRSYTQRFGSNPYDPDRYNNWGVAVPDNSSGYYVEGLDYSELIADWDSQELDQDFYPAWLKLYSQRVPRQLWVLTSNSSLICTLGNATREVSVSFVNNEQKITYGPLQNFEPLFVQRFGNNPSELLTSPTESYAFVAVWQAMLNMLSGNVTTAHDLDEDVRIHAADSNVLLTGLTSCEEFTNNYWVDHWYTAYQNVIIGKDGKPSGNDSVPAQPKFQTRMFGNGPSFRCRNATLARAIEDLATNLTVSLFTSSDLLTQSAATVPVYLSNNELRFQYDSWTVIIAYISTGGSALICVLLGMLAFFRNGITHNNSFSGMVSVSRNIGLDNLFVGHSTGAKPLPKDLENVKLRMGAVSMDASGEDEAGVGHVAFGRKGTVVPIRKGGLYY